MLQYFPCKMDIPHCVFAYDLFPNHSEPQFQFQTAAASSINQSQ